MTSCMKNKKKKKAGEKGGIIKFVFYGRSVFVRGKHPSGTGIALFGSCCIRFDGQRPAASFIKSLCFHSNPFTYSPPLPSQSSREASALNLIKTRPAVQSTAFANFIHRVVWDFVREEGGGGIGKKFMA